MSDLTFKMRINCSYTDPANNIDQLQVTHLLDNAWETLDLGIGSPGFDIFTYAILTCQHMYFRLNAAERNLVLDSSEGIITINTNEHRDIQSLHVVFVGTLKSGEADNDTIKFIQERMELCPVSVNLKNIADRNTSVIFYPLG